MKCPYCGAEVTPNTKCEYCDSFVERETAENSSNTDYQEQLEDIILETAEHFGEALHGTASEIGDAIEKASTPENKRFIKKLIITIIAIIGVFILFFFLFLFSTLRSAFTFMDGLYGNSTEDSYYTTAENVTEMQDIRSLTDEEGMIGHLDENGVMTLMYEDTECDTMLLDETLLNWLNKHGHSLDTVGVLFTTDSDGNVTSLALSSDTFYVLQQQDSGYLVLRSGDVFRTTSEVTLETGCYYDGYFNYPDLNVHSATEGEGNGYSVFDPTCEAKEVHTFTDPYTGEELPVPMIYMDDMWYHCTQELYDACTEGKIIPTDVRVDKSLNIIYTKK
nr:hypothetical protein [Lachnospiraceae bacterium]